MWNHNDGIRLLTVSLCVLVWLIILRLLHWDQIILSLFHLLSPVLFSVILVFLMEPQIERIPARRWLSCTLAYGGLLAVILVSVVVLVPSLMNQGQQMIAALASDPLFSRFSQQLNIPQWLSSNYPFLMRTTKNIAQRVSFLSLSYLSAYFISLDLDYFVQRLVRVLPKIEHWVLFYKTSSRILSHYLRGLVLDMLFLFCAASGVLLLFRVRHALMYALILTVLNLIPYLGAMSGQGIILISHWICTGKVPWLLGICLFAIQQVESGWVQPLIYKKVMDLKPVFTLVVMLVSGYFLGMIGIVLSPVFAGVIQLGLRCYLFAKSTETIGTGQTVWYNFDDFENDEEEE